MTGWLPREVTELFGPEATADESYDLLTVDVPADTWTSALLTARATLGCSYFDWLSAVDEPGTGFRVSAHVVALHPVRRLLVRTTVPHAEPVLDSAVDVYAGAAWHERETHEMFGVDFTGHPGLDPLLLPEGFEGHPLRKDFVLAARVAKAWPGAKEPGESEHGGPKRRQMLPPGVPDPNEWGPLKGQLPPAPARPARGARAAAAAGGPGGASGAGGERPPRRNRSAGAGSVSQTAGAGAAGASGAPGASGTSGAPGTSSTESAAPVRRNRSASQGSVSQTSGASGTESAAPVRRNRSASQGSVSQTGAPASPRRNRSAGAGSASQRAAQPPTSDAPWHNARPAFAEDAKPGDVKPGDVKPGDAKSGNAEAGDAKAGSAKAGDDDKAVPEARPQENPVPPELANQDDAPDTPAGGDPA